MNKLATNIEALLFYTGDTISVSELASFCKVKTEEINEALSELSKNLENRGITLVLNGDTVLLATANTASDFIADFAKVEMQKELSQASLETLAVILYKGPVTKKEIEFIRGVNTSYSIRTLLLRGLIERIPSALDERIFLYSASVDLLTHMGISKLEEMPDWSSVQAELKRNIEVAKNEEGIIN